MVDDVVRLGATASQEAVAREVAHFLRTGDAANRQLALAFDAPRVALDRPASMQRLLRDIERVTEPGTVSNLYVGLADGRFYGLTSDPRDWPTVYWRYSEASERTGGELVYYADANANRVGPELERVGRFDPRTRPWYRAVRDGDDALSHWTEVYPNFGDDTPTITRALALVDADGTRVGVAGADLFVAHVQRFLTTLELSPTAEVFVVDAAGELVAAWGPAAQSTPRAPGLPRPPLESLRYAPYALGLLGPARGGAPNAPAGAPPGESPPSAVPLALAAAAPGSAPAVASAATDRVSGAVTLDGEPGYLAVASFAASDAPPWRVGVFVPAADYLGSVGDQVLRTLPLGAAIAALSLAGIAGFAALVTRPLERLGAVAERIATGRFDETVPVPAGREVGALARAIDRMRRRLGASFEALDGERERARATLDAIEDAVLAIDGTGHVLLANPAAERLLGRAPEELVGRPVERAIEAREAHTGLSLATRALRGELATVRRDGLEIVLARDCRPAGAGRRARLTVAPLGAGAEPRGAVLVLNDTRAHTRRGAELAWAATHDAVTGLVNRRELDARIERAIRASRERGVRHTLAFLDLERFGRINETIGRAGGDELLRQVGAALERAIEPAGAATGEGPAGALGDARVATVARVGGDDFAVLLETEHGPGAHARLVAARDAVADLRFAWTDRVLRPSLSVGTARIDADTLDAGAALARAATACALARREGANRLRAHEQGGEADERSAGDRAALARLEAALAEDRLVLHLQRIVGLDGRARPDAELLVRLVEPDGSLAPPSSFVPGAERLGAAPRVDRRVVELALAALAARPAPARELGRCSINLSGATLGDPTFLPWFLARLERSGVDPATLGFEITETAAVSHLSTARALMHALGERGIAFSLDDFGTGLSSFAYLKALPIDALKIDAEFVRGIASDARDAALVRSMVELARSLGIGAVAEGVEDEATLEALRALGVGRVQGFLLDRPAPLVP